MNRLGRGIAIAGAAAALVIGGSVAARASEHTGGEVKCSGVNECKGKGACGTAEHDCAGKNACKGKGWVKVKSADECKEKGGTVVEDEAR
jgi:hypothetical protein